MTKEQALTLLRKHTKNPNLIKHGYAVGFAMVGIYDYLNKEGRLDGTPPREVWEVVGILHDSDYEITKDDWSQHTLHILNWLEENGMDKNDPIYLAIQSHNSKFTKLRSPETIMEWALECCDELTGFIIACTLVLPDKKLSSLKLKSIKKKWKQPSFARNVERVQIEQCEEKLGIKLDEFIGIVLKSMQANSNELGL